MSLADFTVAIKSTIDFHAKQIADSKGLPFLDLASAPFDNALVESDQPAVCWEFSTISEMPRDPLWYAEFDVGAMTMLDPSQYISLDIVGAIAEVFKTGATLSIKDYSGADAPEAAVGSLHIVASGVAPQQMDRATGVRFVSIAARASRYL